MVAFTVAADTSPADIFVADLATGKARRLTTALNPDIDENQLVEATVARFKSYDGLEVPGVLYKPREASASNPVPALVWVHRSEEHTSELQSLMRISYAVFCLK